MGTCKTYTEHSAVSFEATAGELSSVVTGQERTFDKTGDSSLSPPASTTGTAVLTAKATTAKTAQNTTMPSATSPAVVYGDNRIEFIGRFSSAGNGRYRFDWSGSTIRAGFNGTGIAVKLTMEIPPNGEDKNDYLNISVDGGTSRVLTVQQGKTHYVLAEGLPSGHHYVEIVKRTEGQFGSLLRFDGFDYGDGEAAAAPRSFSRRIEVFGDSISAGYGNEGYRPGFRLKEENASQTYGAIAAKLLNAECSIVALSGYGCSIGVGGYTDTVIPRFFESALFHDVNARGDFPNSAPDAVVINLGTNDYRTQGVFSETNYYQAYLDFVAAIRGKYPNTYIVCMTGGGGTTQNISVLQRVIDTTIHTTKNSRIGLFEGELSAATGSDGHPSAYGHRIVGEQLAAFLRNKLGW